MIGFNPSTPCGGYQKPRKIFKSFQNIMLYISDNNTTVLVSASVVSGHRWHNAKGMNNKVAFHSRKDSAN